MKHRRPNKFFLIAAVFFLFYTPSAIAGSTGSESLSNKSTSDTAGECFEGVSRAVFKFNHGLDKAIFEPVARGYRALPVPIRTGTGNVIDNLRSLLTFSNNVLQGDFKEAGNTAGRFIINSTVGILGIWDPAAAAFGLDKTGEEDFVAWIERYQSENVVEKSTGISKNTLAIYSFAIAGISILFLFES